jgi:DNA-binding NarL/FixJ family response regulator
MSDPPNAVPVVINVAVIEDRHELRQSLAILIAGTQGLACTGTFRSMEEALEAIARKPPHIALVDIGLPGISGIDGIRILKERHPQLLTLVLSIHDDDARVFGALCAGACGYLLKDTPPSKLIESIREVMNGGSPMTPEVARRVVTLFREFRPPARVDYQLTPHELRILGMLVAGHNYRTASVELGVSVHTIGFHMRSIYEKLQVHSKSAAVARALKEGLVR